MPLSRLWTILFFCWAASTLASDGRIELNQASIQAAGGFPYTISAPGSYVLTGSLEVPASTDGLIISGDNISIDLNGFTISSQGNCDRSTCVPGDGEAIRPDSPTADGHRVVVRNGVIMRFADNCVRLNTQAQVRDLIISECGGAGIMVGEESIVTLNTVDSTGAHGLRIVAGAIYANNTISDTGLAGGGEPAVEGGKATAGNYCSDGQCGWVDTRRRFYLTQSTHTGAGTLESCDDGFHMASIWEIEDFTSLRYDRLRGVSLDDSGFGPPVGETGWARTGYESSASNSAGFANCEVYSIDEPGYWGTVISLRVSPEPIFENGTEDLRLPKWRTETKPCFNVWPVWCIED